MQKIKFKKGTGYFFDQETEIWDFLISKWRELASKAIAEHGSFNVALSGGKTPQPFYKALANASNLPWDKTHLFLVDERFVPLDHADSNYAALKENLFDVVKLPGVNQHVINAQLPNANAVALNYAIKLQEFFPQALNEKNFPSFDLMLLGIGEDGHIASLFPGHSVLQEKEAWVVAAEDDKHKHVRMTLTLPVINSAKQIIFLVTGQNKAQIISEVIQKANPNYPASKVDQCLLVTDIML